MKEQMQKQQEQMQSLQEQMQAQQDNCPEVLETLPVVKTKEGWPKPASKFGDIYSSKEEWRPLLEQFQHHLNIYDISSDEKKRSCLLFWIGAQTFDLLENLFGDRKISHQSWKDAATDFLLIFWIRFTFKQPGR